jgi:hypothetical protein
MKRTYFFLAVLLLAAAPLLRGQDAAVEERLNKLNGHVEDLLAAQADQQKRIAALAKEVEALRAQQNQPNPVYASQEDLRKLAEKFQGIAQEIDQKRVADNETIKSKLDVIAKAMSSVASAPPSKKAPPKTVTVPAGNPASAAAQAGAPPEKGYGYYTIQPNDTLSSIAKAYNDQGIKLTSDQIQKANPGLDERKLIPGKKIWIPASAQ